MMRVLGGNRRFRQRRGEDGADGFPCSAGYEQIVSLSKKDRACRGKIRVTVVIEAVNRRECNIINTFEEGCRLADDVAHDSVKVLVDFYHLTLENEPEENVERLGKKYLRQVHLTAPRVRRYPDERDEAATLKFASALKAADTTAGLSCEAPAPDFDVQR
jgi:sugar phosphate isomerase/epimerase